MSSSVTMKDVAKHAGVSLATVSKVINDDKTVSSDNTRKVWDAVEALGYKTNYAAKLLKTSKSRIVTIILPNIIDPNFAGIFTGAERYLSDNGYTASLCVTGETRSRENQSFEQALLQKVAGVILVTCQPDEPSELIDQLIEADAKIVHCEREPVQRNHAFLEFDNNRAAFECATGLVEQGLRRFLLVSGPGEYSSEAETAKGFRRALEAAIGQGVEFDIVETNFDKESAFSATVSCINQRFVPEVVFATAMPLYQGALKATDILRHRLANPVKFVAFGVESWSSVNADSLLTIGRDSLGMGEAAAEAILDNIRNPVAHRGAYRLMECSIPEATPAPRLSRQSFRIKSGVEKELRLLLLDSVSMKGLVDLQSDFEARYGIKIATDFLEYDELYSAVCDSSIRSRYDIAMIDHPWLPDFANAGWLARLDPLLDDRPEIAASLVPNVMDVYVKHAGGHYGIPLRLDTQTLFYRRDLFEEHSLRRAFKEFSNGGTLRPPETWTEFNSIGRFFTKRFNPQSPTEFGLALGGKRPYGALGEFLPRLWAFGGRVLDERGRVVINSRNSLEALCSYVECFDYAAPDAIHHLWREQRALFCAGKTAMTTMFNAPATALADRSISKVVGKLGFSPIPGGCPMLGGWVTSVVNGSKRVEAAFDWMAWAVGQDIAPPYTVLGGSPPRLDIYQNSEMRFTFPWLPGVVDALSTSRKRDVPSVGDPGVLLENTFEEALGGGVHETLVGNIQPAEALVEIEQDLTNILSRR